MKFVIAALVVACAAAAGAGQVDLAEVHQNLFATCFASDQEGWMVGELGRIFRTRDGGVTWEQQDAHTKRPFLAMSCLDPKTAWIAGKEGIVYATKDAAPPGPSRTPARSATSSRSSSPLRSGATAPATTAR